MAFDLRTLKSSAPAGARVFDIAFLPGAFATIPSTEETGLSASQIMDRTAHEDGPLIAEEKGRIPYYVPCLLKVAPYVGKTAERYPGQSGKQRSGAHMTAGAWFAFDLDGIPHEARARILDRLEAAGVVFCAHSTYSHGKNPDEVRMRVLLFMDRALEPVQWADVWHVLNGLFLEGLADPQTAKLSQQAGVWATHPARVKQAFRIVRPGALLSADALLAIVPPKPERRAYVAPKLSEAAQVQKYAAATGVLDANDYHAWMVGLGGLKGAVLLGELSDEDGAALWFVFSESADESAKANNDDARFDPERMWSDWVPSAAPAAALVGKLFATAKDAALMTCRTEIEQAGHLSDKGTAAARYLATYHRRAFEELTSEVQA